MEAEVKDVPVAVTVNAPEPATAVAGAMPVSTGTGATTASATAAEVPPPGAGVVTVTETLPRETTSAAVNCAFSEEAETYVVGRAAPFTLTTERDVKELPLTPSVSGPEPATTLAGDRAASTGTGAFTVNVCTPDVPPPGAGVLTDTATVLATASWAALSCVVKVVALTNVVVCATPPHSTCDPLTKLLPVSVRVVAAEPATAEAGVKALSTGTGFGATVTVNGSVPEMLVELFSTDTTAEPAVARSVAGI
jgi:hypothetical protein